MATKKTFDPEALVQQQVENIDEAIEQIDARLKRFDKLQQERTKLLSARRALLGGNKLTGAGGTQVRQEDIVEFLEKQPGSTPTEIAERFGVTYSVIASHLYRGKDKFLGKNKRWWVRDPENGLNTVDDLPDGDDDE